MVYRNRRGEYHREDGPAVIGSNGGKEWFRNGLRHRIDGPALIFADGNKMWFVHGVHMLNEGKFRQNACISDEEMVMIILKYGEIK